MLGEMMTVQQAYGAKLQAMPNLPGTTISMRSLLMYAIAANRRCHTTNMKKCPIMMVRLTRLGLSIMAANLTCQMTAMKKCPFKMSQQLLTAWPLESVNSRSSWRPKKWKHCLCIARLKKCKRVQRKKQGNLSFRAT